jgi:hypothetical protein
MIFVEFAGQFRGEAFFGEGQDFDDGLAARRSAFDLITDAQQVTGAYGLAID